MVAIVPSLPRLPIVPSGTVMSIENCTFSHEWEWHGICERPKAAASLRPLRDCGLEVDVFVSNLLDLLSLFPQELLSQLICGLCEIFGVLTKTPCLQSIPIDLGD